ncbi:MAG: hypothetical protein PHR47_02545 [Candidatus Pacebacteria bacterium]|nr:hypothetical protein [Candidatus Paceibacterota bacterium]
MNITIVLEYNKEKASKNIEKEMLDYDDIEKINGNILITDIKIETKKKNSFSYLTNIISYSQNNFNDFNEIEGIEKSFQEIRTKFEKLFPYYKDIEYIGCVIEKTIEIENDEQIKNSKLKLIKKTFIINNRDEENYNYIYSYTINKNKITAIFDINTRFVKIKNQEISSLIKRIESDTSDNSIRNKIETYGQ